MSNCTCGSAHILITNARRRKAVQRRVRRYDPTATTTLREAFAREVRVRFKALARDVKEAVLQLDVLGLATNAGTSEGAKKAWDTRGRGQAEEPASSPLAGWVGIDAPDKTTEKPADFNSTKGSDKQVNKDLVKAAGVKMIVPDNLKDDLEEAIAHVAADKSLAPLLKGRTIEVKDMGGRYGTAKSSLYLDAKSLREDGPGFAAVIIRHELEHYRLTAKGVPSGKQESQVRFTAGMWASLNHGLVKAKNPRAAKGFKQSALDQGVPVRNELTVNAVQLPQRAFAFGRSAERVEAFRDWLNQKVRERVFSTTTGPGNRSAAMGVPWSRVYVDSAYKRGIARADAAIRKAGANNPLAATWTPAPIAARFLGPIHADRIGLVHSRVYSELKGITDSMERSIADTLARGIGEGRSPRELASALENRITGEGDELGIWDRQGRWIPAERRAELLARTEIINAHTKASVATYREAGVVDVEVLAEWQATPDGRVCPKCAELNGKIFTLDEIERLIPLHPLCRCAAIPAGVGEEVDGRTRRADKGTGFDRDDMTEDAKDQLDQPDLATNAGTSEGAKKAWDTRGRGQKEDESQPSLAKRWMASEPVVDKKLEKIYEDPEKAEALFRDTIRRRGDITMYHESSISNLDSITKQGILVSKSESGEAVFATIGKPSEFVSSPEKIRVVFTVRGPTSRRRIQADMRYDADNPYGDALKQHGVGLDGMDVAYDADVKIGDIDRIEVIKDGQLADTVYPKRLLKFN